MGFTKKVVHFLEEKGYQIWMDKRRLLEGANFLKEIADGIGKADVFLSFTHSTKIHNINGSTLLTYYKRSVIRLSIIV